MKSTDTQCVANLRRGMKKLRGQKTRKRPEGPGPFRTDASPRSDGRGDATEMQSICAAYEKQIGDKVHSWVSCWDKEPRAFLLEVQARRGKLNAMGWAEVFFGRI